MPLKAQVAIAGTSAGDVELCSVLWWDSRSSGHVMALITALEVLTKGFPLSDSPDEHWC